ncbi:MAG: VWA domain-containing protein [Nitrospirota bacterium]|nr:VWA domain-containing protein [Nitrospirota bacterium]
MKFADPLWFALLPLCLLALLWVLRRRGPRLFHPLLPAMVAAGLPRGRRVAWRHLPAGLRLLALLLLVAALARPQQGNVVRHVTSHGVDIALALDISGSMTAQDFPPDRLEVARKVVDEFVAARPDDRLALVVFSAQALTRVPLTLDHAMLRASLAEVQIGQLEDGTAIGSALATAVARLRGSPEGSRVVVLLTDGVNNRGDVDPRTAARMAAQMGIRVYTVGVGREGTFPQVINDPVRGPVRVMARTQVDEKLLEEIAAVTGGRFFRARDAGALAAIYRRIDELEKHPVEATVYRDWQDRHPPLVWGALALLLLEWLLAATLWRRLPG